MVMGPDCGTSIVNGIPLGLRQRGASRPDRRRRRIGHRDAGGHRPDPPGRLRRVPGARHRRPRPRRVDRRHLDAARAGRTRRRSRHESHRPGVQAARAEAVAAKVLARRRGQRQAGGRHLPRRRSRPSITRNGVYGAAYLAQAADMAVALGRGEAAASPRTITIGDEVRSTLREKAAAMAPSQRYVRGIFSGGTFCFEAQLVHRSAGIARILEHPGRRAMRRSTDIAQEPGEHHHRHGRRRVHPGPAAPDDRPVVARRRIREEIADPTTAVVLFDVVLGYGSAADPIAGLLPRHRGRSQGRPRAAVTFIGYVCGTDLDPQDRDQVVVRAEVRRRPGGLEQCRSRDVVRRAHLRADREPTHEKPCSSRTSRWSTSGCRVSPTTSSRPAAAPPN